MSGLARGNIEINIEECKGCGLCVESCPPKCLALADELSAYGVHPALYAGDGCTGPSSRESKSRPRIGDSR